jgi:hypothetical protein
LRLRRIRQSSFERLALPPLLPLASDANPCPAQIAEFVLDRAHHVNALVERAVGAVDRVDVALALEAPRGGKRPGDLLEQPAQGAPALARPPRGRPRLHRIAIALLAAGKAAPGPVGRLAAREERFISHRHSLRPLRRAWIDILLGAEFGGCPHVSPEGDRG